MSAVIETGMSLYEANQQLMVHEKPLDPLQRTKKIHDIANCISAAVQQAKTKQFYMLLCNDRKDYTVFSFSPTMMLSMFIADFEECLGNRGEVLAIDQQESGAWEIWIRDPASEKCVVYYFFNYNEGVLSYE